MKRLLKSLAWHRKALDNMRRAANKTAKESRLADYRKAATARGIAYENAIIHLDMAIEEATR